MAVPATVQANDAQLEALYTDWRAAWGVWSKANTAHDETRIDAFRSCAPSPVEGDYTSGEELEEAWDAWGAARQAAVERSGAVELKRHADVAYDAEQAAFNRLMEAPVSSARGVMFKLRGCYFDGEIAQIRAGDNDIEDLPAEYAAIIYRDLERLAGEARL
jgi:hypothetical protein